MTARKMVAAGVVQVACQLGERHGISRAELLYVGALEPKEISDPDTRVPADALVEMLSYLLERTGDRSLGLRFAEAMDLRTQGFWGYAFISCLSGRQMVDLLLRFQRLRHSGNISYRVDGEWAVFELEGEVPLGGLSTIGGDAFLATFCLQRQRWVPESGGQMQAWLNYPEEPHHQELRRLVGGPILFDAPFFRWQIPARELDLPVHLVIHVRVDELLHARLHVGEVLFQARVGIELEALQVRSQRALARADLRAEDVPERVRGIGGDDQDPLALVGEAKRDGRGDGRLPDAALAADVDDAPAGERKCHANSS